MERNLKDMLPLFGVENDCILSKQGDITVGFEATLPEIFTMSREEYEAFHQAWIKAIRLLPKNSVFHKQDWFHETKYRADVSKDKSSFFEK